MAEDRLDTDEFDEPEEEEQERRHNFLVLFFLFVYDETQDRITQLGDALADGKITTKQWAKAFREELTGRHAEAASIGRRMAGDMAPASVVDTKAGEAAWAEQEKYFSKFVADLEEGRYTVTNQDEGEELSQSLSEKAFNSRAKKYGEAIGGTAHEAFREAMGDDALRWVLGDKMHCVPTEGYPYTCPENSEMEPKPASEWDTYPKSSKQPCFVNCDCSFESADGKYSTRGI